MRPGRPLAWLGVGALVVLAARAVAYALSPSPLAVELAKQAGGPRLPIVTVVSVGLAVALSSALVWLAALGVRERRLLEARPVQAEPALRLGLLLVRALVLWIATMGAFALLESYLHWRAGLGWHGLHCLTGPVHRDAIPLLGGFSLVAAAAAAALEHVLGWMRRTLARLAPAERLASPSPRPRRPRLEPVPRGVLAGMLGARGPPSLS